MNRILVVNVNWLGDVIFSSPIFKALKSAYPQAKISCLAVPRVKEILESIPEIDEIIIYDEKSKHWNPLAKLGLIAELRRKKFDIVFLLHRSWTRAFLVFLAGIPQRVGYDAKGRGVFLTHKVVPLKEPVHRRDYYLNVIESFGVKVQDRRTRLSVDPESQEEIQTTLSRKGIKPEDFLVVIHPGANWDLKRWPLENFARLIQQLMLAGDKKVVIPGSSKDEPLVREIISHRAMNRLRPVVLTGQTNLKQLIALMKRANLVISSDSGPLHVATSVGTAVIGLFGPTRPEVTGPCGVGKAVVLQKEVGCNHEPCYYLECPDNICMQAVTVHEVMNEVAKIRLS